MSQNFITSYHGSDEKQENIQNYPAKQFFQKKWVKVVLIFNILVIVAIVALFIINAMKTAIVYFSISPIDSTISVNGKNDYSNGEYSFLPGTYEIKISHENLDPKTFSITISDHSYTDVSVFLTKNGNTEFYELKENYQSLEKLQKIASSGDNRTIDHDTSAEPLLQTFQESYSIFQKLPIIDKTPSKYGFNNGVKYAYDTLQIKDGRALDNCTKTLCLQITDTSGEKKDFALSVINKLGFNSDNYQIIYEKVSYE